MLDKSRGTMTLRYATSVGVESEGGGVGSSVCVFRVQSRGRCLCTNVANKTLRPLPTCYFAYCRRRSRSLLPGSSHPHPLFVHAVSPSCLGCTHTQFALMAVVVVAVVVMHGAPTVSSRDLDQHTWGHGPVRSGRFVRSCVLWHVSVRPASFRGRRCCHLFVGHGGVPCGLCVW